MSNDTPALQPLSFEEAQQAVFHTLARVAGICEELHLRYCLAYGTLLGAARHRGFIPWDDDADIQMPRPDYNRLLSHFIANAEALYPLRLFCQETCGKYPYGIARISDDRYAVKGECDIDYGLGAFVDVYPYDGIGSDEEQALETLEQCAVLKLKMLDVSKPVFPVPEGLNWKGKLEYLSRRGVGKLLGKGYWYGKICQLASRHSWEDSEYAGCLAWAYSSARRALFRRSQFDSFAFLPFCGREFCVPRDYDAVLRQIYGDYMRLPPPQQRVPRHNCQTFKKL